MAKVNKENVKVGDPNITPNATQKEISLENIAFPHGIGQEGVEMEATDIHPHMKPGKKFKVHKAQVEKLESKGWARLLMFALFMLGTLAASAQITFKNNTYRGVTSDTTIDAGTGIVYARIPAKTTTTAVQVIVVKNTGTVAGTLSLWGSVDGTNFEAVRLKDATTALHTYTATNVPTQTFIWNLSALAYLHYQVRHTGGTTMSAKLFAVGLTQ